MNIRGLLIEKLLQDFNNIDEEIKNINHGPSKASFRKTKCYIAQTVNSLLKAQEETEEVTKLKTELADRI